MSIVEILPASPIDLEAQSSETRTVGLLLDSSAIVIDASPPPINLVEVETLYPNWEIAVESFRPVTAIDVVFPALIRFEVEAKTPQSSTGSNRVVIAVETNNQTVFTLPSSPKNPHKSELFVNGIKATYGGDYTIDGSILRWLESLMLEPSDEIEILYE